MHLWGKALRYVKIGSQCPKNHFLANKKTMNFVQVITIPPLVPCAGDEGTPSPYHEYLYQYHEKNTKYLSHVKHVTVAGWRHDAVEF